MTEESTRIEDLPQESREIDDSSQIVNSMKQQDFDDLSEDGSEDIKQDRIEKPVAKTESSSPYFDYNHIMENLKHTLVIFSIVFVVTNTEVYSLLEKIPMLASFEKNSIKYNATFAFIVALIYFISNYIIHVFY